MHRNDEPTLLDGLERQGLVKEIGEEIRTCRPPMVFGVHGDWGAGKTSFLHSLHWYLGGECPESLEWQAEAVKPVDWPKEWGAIRRPEKVDEVVVWFEAWRYQHESNPVVALLNEIRVQLEWYQSLWLKRGKGVRVVQSALLNLKSLTEMIGFSPVKVQKDLEKWDREHYATKLPTYVIRGLLDDAIGTLLRTPQDKNRVYGPRLIVLIDDLDRCEGDMAFRLLEGIKVYLNLNNCVFVLGMDQQIIEQAVRNHMPCDSRDETGAVDVRSALAREYVEKICRRIWYLPCVSDPAVFLGKLLDSSKVAGSQAICNVVTQYKCLPPNPRKLKAFADTVRRFAAQMEYRPGNANTFLLKHLKPQKQLTGDPVAGLLVVMASLHQFHYELYQALAACPEFYEVLYEWATKGEHDHLLLHDIRLPHLAGKDSKLPPGKLAPRVPTYADVLRREVFRIQELMLDLGSVARPAILRCILGTQHQKAAGTSAAPKAKVAGSKRLKAKVGSK